MQSPEGFMRFGTGIAAMGLVVAGCSSEAPTVQGDPHHEQAPAPAACYEPTVKELSTVDHLLSAPPAYYTNPNYHKMSYENAEQAIAKHMGMTLVPNAMFMKVDTDYANHEPYSVIYKDTARYLGEFGVRMRVATRNDFKNGDDGSVPTQKQLNSKTSAYDIDEIAEGFRDLPVQYVQASGLKHVLLIANTSGDAAYAELDGAVDTVAVDITAGVAEPGPQVLDHEMYHLLDRRECGSIDAQYLDPDYTALDGSGNVYKDTGRDGMLALTDSPEITSLTTKLINEQNNYLDPGAQADQHALYSLLKKVSSRSLYGFTNAVEEKAEIGRDIPVPSVYSKSLSERTPILKEKFEYLLARLYHFRPDVVRYFAAVSSRPYTELYKIVHKPFIGPVQNDSK